jgi:hypothetical protein
MTSAVSWRNGSLRVLLISALAATLVGCACFAPQPATTNGCPTMTGYACLDPTAAQIDSKPVTFKVEAQDLKAAIAPSTQNPPSARLGKTNPVAKGARHAIAGKIRPLPSAELNDNADIEKAKATIAAMMENPASSQFGEMKRTVRDLLGESIDTICGYVRGKNAAGGDTGEMPFLYIIQHDEAYIVDGTSTMAETAYRNLCN